LANSNPHDLPFHTPARERRLSATDEELRDALESAHLPTLIMTLVHLTGDRSLLRDDLRPAGPSISDASAGLNEAQQKEIRERAFSLLREFRDGGGILPEPPSENDVANMLSFCVGQEVPPEYLPLMLEELGLETHDASYFEWRRPVSPEQLDGFKVLIIGAGMSGICAAIRLSQAGIPFEIIERNDGVGGTWQQHRYPGCRVDVPNRFYAYSFEPNHEWSGYFSEAAELRAYFERCADRYGISDKIRLSTEVLGADFDDETGRWTVQTRSSNGAEGEIEANIVISAVGIFNRPTLPSFPGIESFQGEILHTSSWDDSLPIEGQRIAVIGTGATGVQLIPALSDLGAEVHVFQRTPHWIIPNPNYFEKVPTGEQWLLGHLPFYAEWSRIRFMWLASDGFYPAVQVDPDWHDPDVSLNAQNEMFRNVMINYMQSELAGDEELIEKCTPDYPAFGKRIIIDSGWFRTLRQENVHLISNEIDRIEPQGIVTQDGQLHTVDAIVFATGFQANRFLVPMSITARGQDLREQWGDEPRAHVGGVAVPGYPNFFCLYGPNTNPAHGGSIIFQTECEVRYAFALIRELVESGARSIECKPEAHESFSKKTASHLARTVWSHPKVNSYYLNASRNDTVNSPFRLIDFWEMTREPNLDDYALAKLDEPLASQAGD